MTITEQLPRTNLQIVTHDLYRDIHKGIRAELFGVTLAAGSIDPTNRAARVALSDRVRDAIALLVSHAEHEDAHLQPAIEAHLPALAERVETDHLTLESRMVTLQEMVDEAARVAADAGDKLHRFYLEFASFTGAYLEHQDVEERDIMPALEPAIGPDACFAIERAIVGSIPPEEMATSLALMLPAMNIDNRAAMLGGMQAGAPPEVFEGVWGLAASVLAPTDHRDLATRLGLG